MEPELFYWIGGATAVAALVVSAIGIKSESFPASRGIMATTIGIFVILGVGSTTYGVVNARSEQEDREAEIAEEQEAADEQELEAEETGAEGPITGDQDVAEETGADPETAATDDGVVAMTEYSFGPDAVTVKQGATVTAENEGAVVHNLTVVDGSEELAATEDVDGGQSAELTVDIEPGTYRMICTIPGHEDLGMAGDFTVE